MIKRCLVLSLVIVALWGCQTKSSKTSKNASIETEDVQFSKDGELQIFNKEGKTLLKLDIEVAESDYEQETGLMYRKEMATNQGMLFVYPDERPRPNFYMKNTYIALDLLYINAKNEIVDFNENAKPLDESSLPSDAPAKYVLEVNAGTVAEFGIEVGDKIEIER